MEYVYSFENASLTLKVFEYLYSKSELPIAFVTVIHQIDGWLVRVKMKSPLNSQQSGNLQAFLQELGTTEETSRRLKMVFLCLEAGYSALDIMRRYQIVVVSHGSPQHQEIKAFQQLFTSG